MSRSRNLPVTIAAASTLAVAAFVAGRFSAPEATTTTNAAATSSTTRSERLNRQDRGSDTASRRNDRSERSGARPEDLLADLERIIRTTDPLSRTQAWLDYVNSLDPAEFESVVASFRSLGITESRMGEYSMLLSAWARVDPLAALDYAEQNTGSRFARNTILSTWSASDPDGAIRWAQDHHQGEGANPWMIGIIQGLASSDPTRASQLLAEMPYSEERGQALGELLPHILSQGADAAKAWVAGITDERLRDGAIGRIAESLAATDPAGTAAWLTSNPGNASNSALDDVYSTWVKSDRNAAISSYQSLPSGELRTNALRGIANSMALEDPAAAARFLDQNQGDTNDRVYQQFAWHAFGNSPQVAVESVMKLSDNGMRSAMLGRTLDGWLRRDFNAASQWISSNQLPDDVRQRVQNRMQEIQQRQQ